MINQTKEFLENAVLILLFGPFWLIPIVGVYFLVVRIIEVVTGVFGL